MNENEINKEYKIIDLNNFKKISQYEWFKTFSNPCYGFNVKMDITNLLSKTHQESKSFFINMLYVVSKGMSKVDEFHYRIINNELRFYKYINPTFLVMNLKNEIYDNAGIIDNDYDYELFYKLAKEEVERVKNKQEIKKEFNDNNFYNDYYISCVPWLNYESVTHPIPSNNVESSSVPRVSWGKYYKENDRYYLTLNITVSHALVDGKALSDAFNNIQEMIDLF